jgi:peptidoglycan-N-acetylglucosamine deacetylase
VLLAGAIGFEFRKEGFMVKLCRVLAGAIVVVLLSAGATAGATQSLERPLQVKSATLRQDGQYLVWEIVLQQPFAPDALARDHRSLCLLLERQANGSVAGQICVTGRPGRHAEPWVVYVPITASGPGRAQELPATIARTSPSDLTATFLPTYAGLRYRGTRWQVLSRVNPPACAAGASCTALFPARPASLALHAPKLVGCEASGPPWVFHGPANVRDIALTFDDGPDGTPPSADFVDLLAREHVPATFFEIGRQISEYDPHGKVEREMLADGDMIGDHTWSHPDMTRLSASGQRDQLVSTAAAIRRATGFQPCLLRAPYGAVDPALLRVAHGVGMATIQWDVDPRDWALPGVDAIVANVVANAHNGAIVIQHFGGGPRYQTLSALPREIAALRHRGYRFVNVAQMLGYRLIYK